MGQLEKYGLYVLCLVIFLILGVALWGEPAVAAESPSKTSTQAAKVPERKAAPTYDLSDFKELMSPAPRPDGGKPAPATAPGAATDGGARDAERAVEPKTVAKDAAEPKSAPRRTHTIVAGDTFEGIAKQELGDVGLVALLCELNPKVAPAKMQVGKQLVLPSAAEIAALRQKSEPAGDKAADKTAGGTADKAADKPADKASSKPAATGRTHRVARGDTLEGIARTYFGSAKRLDDIKKLNPSVDPTRMRIGQLIRLPD